MYKYNLNSKFMNMNLKLNEIKFEDLVQVAKKARLIAKLGNKSK